MAEAPRLFARDAGGGPSAIVLLHGFGGCHAVWDGVTEALAEGDRVIAYDLPGHGGSLALGALSPKASARAVLSDLAERGVERAHLVGHSMGGAIAILAALAEPGRVASLTLLAPGGIGPEINGKVLALFAAATTLAEVEAALRAMSGPDAVADPGSVYTLTTMRRLPGQTEVLAGLADAIGGNDRQGAFPPEMLASIACPVTVAWGRLDPVLPFAQTGNLPPAARLVTLDRAGHMLIEEAPAEVAALIAASLGAG